MTPDAPDLVRWTVRLAVACYAARLLADTGNFGSLRLRRWIWSVGLVFFLAHVTAAFTFVHAWSHAAAYRETARQTAELTGFEWGGGLWANYAFLLLWTADAAAWWIVGAEYPVRFRRTYVAVQAVFAFLMCNATAVFGPSVWRPIVATFGLVLAAALVLRARGNAAHPENSVAATRLPSPAAGSAPAERFASPAPTADSPPLAPVPPLSRSEP